MRVAMTGAGGGLGGALWVRLDAEGHELLHITTKPGKKYYSYFELQRLIEDGVIDVVIHLAWTNVPADFDAGKKISGFNDLELIEFILGAIQKAMFNGCRAPLFVFPSSCSVYGEGDGDKVFSEVDDVCPISPYGHAKRMAEEVLEKAVSDFGLRAMILRLTNPYGFSRKGSRPQGVIPFMLDAINKEEKFTVWGDGNAVKDFIYIDDVLNALCGMFEKEITGVFNLSGGGSVSICQLIEIIERVAGNRLLVEYREAPAWDVKRGRYSNDKMLSTFGWAPQVPLEEGVKSFFKTFSFAGW